MARITTRTLSLSDLNESPHNWDATGSDITLDADNKHGLRKGSADEDGYTVIAMKKIPDYESWTFGHPYGMGSGVVYVRLDSPGGGQIQGRARIKMCGPEFNLNANMHEHHTDSQYNTNPTDRFNNPTCNIPTINKDKYEVAWFRGGGHLILLFKPDVDDQTLDVSDADNKIILPISVVPRDSSRETW